MHTINETNNVTLFFQGVWIMVGDREESLGERSRNQVCGYLPKDPTESPIRALEWVQIICVGNTPLSSEFVTVQKSLDHQRLFNCSALNTNRGTWYKSYDYEDRLEFKELGVAYAEDEDLIGMSKDNIPSMVFISIFLFPKQGFPTDARFRSPPLQGPSNCSILSL